MSCTSALSAALVCVAFRSFATDAEMWNCVGSSLHALAVKPRPDISHTSSPMISPGSSPRFLRRNPPPGTVVVPTAAPPPLPPRKASPTQDTPSSSSTPRPMLGDQSQSVTNLHAATEAPPAISKSNSMLEMRIDNNIELSAAETIVGLVVSESNLIVPPRHLSCPSNRAVNRVQPSKSNTTPNMSKPYENVEPMRLKRCLNPLEKESNVSYENLNIDYIRKLVSEGYSRDAVIRALGISRNNVDMACDILHEFGTKLG